MRQALFQKQMEWRTGGGGQDRFGCVMGTFVVVMPCLFAWVVTVTWPGLPPHLTVHLAGSQTWLTDLVLGQALPTPGTPSPLYLPSPSSSLYYFLCMTLPGMPAFFASRLPSLPHSGMHTATSSVLTAHGGWPLYSLSS